MLRPLRGLVVFTFGFVALHQLLLKACDLLQRWTFSLEHVGTCVKKCDKIWSDWSPTTPCRSDYGYCHVVQGSPTLLSRDSACLAKSLSFKAHRKGETFPLGALAVLNVCDPRVFASNEWCVLLSRCIQHRFHHCKAMASPWSGALVPGVSTTLRACRSMSSLNFSQNMQSESNQNQISTILWSASSLLGKLCFQLFGVFGSPFFQGLLVHLDFSLWAARTRIPRRKMHARATRSIEKLRFDHTGF